MVEPLPVLPVPEELPCALLPPDIESVLEPFRDFLPFFPDIEPVPVVSVAIPEPELLELEPEFIEPELLPEPRRLPDIEPDPEPVEPEPVLDPVPDPLWELLLDPVEPVDPVCCAGSTVAATAAIIVVMKNFFMLPPWGFISRRRHNFSDYYSLTVRHVETLKVSNTSTY